MQKPATIKICISANTEEDTLLNYCFYVYQSRAISYSEKLRKVWSRIRFFREDKIHDLMDLLVLSIKPVQVIHGFPSRPIVFEVLIRIELTNGAFSKWPCFEDRIACVLVGLLWKQNELQRFIMSEITFATAHYVLTVRFFSWLLQKTRNLFINKLIKSRRSSTHYMVYHFYRWVFRKIFYTLCNHPCDKRFSCADIYTDDQNPT